MNANRSMKSLESENDIHCMPCSTNFSVILKFEILSTETNDFPKQLIILKSFNSVLLADFAPINIR